MILKTACERLLSSFMLVAATVRDLFPSDISTSMSWKDGERGHVLKYALGKFEQKKKGKAQTKQLSPDLGEMWTLEWQ